MKAKSFAMAVALVIGVGLSGGTYAAFISFGNVVTNGEFGTDASPSLTGWTAIAPDNGVNARSSTDVINTNAGTVGFSSFFASAFAVLGDQTGALGNIPSSGVSSLAQTISLPSTLGGSAVLSYNIVISFSSAFNGFDESTSNNDVFSGGFGSIALFSQASSGLPTASVATGDTSLKNNPFSASILGLAPGDYLLSFSLNEAGSGTSTAAGIDSVSITGSAEVREQVPEPATLALLGLGLAGLGFSRRRTR